MALNWDLEKLLTQLRVEGKDINLMKNLYLIPVRVKVSWYI